jgi:hypothetical protein
VRVVCLNCGTNYSDPGGDLAGYYCQVCGQARLQRVAPQPGDQGAIAGALAGAAIGGVFGGPAGALFGAIAGLVLGSKR